MTRYVDCVLQLGLVTCHQTSRFDIVTVRCTRLFRVHSVLPSAERQRHARYSSSRRLRYLKKVLNGRFGV
jgi:hypothetical protein